MNDDRHAELEAIKMIGGGVCLAHTEGTTWMVAGALPGERVLARSLRRRAGVIEAQTLNVLDNHHPARLESPCPHAGPCGGCDWPHVEVATGAALKAEVAAESARWRPDLSRALRTAPIRTSDSSYRLRARLHWDPDGANLGFFGRRSSTVHPLSTCRVVSPRLLAAVPAISTALARHTDAAGDVEWLEDLEGRRAICALLPTLGAAAHDTPSIPPQDALEGVVDGFHLLDASGTPIKGWGSHSVEMETPIPLCVPIGAFFQGNRHLVPWLFTRVADLVGPEPVPTWDLHAGVGFLAAAAYWAAPRELVLTEPHRPSAAAASANLRDALVEIGISAEAYCHRNRNLPAKALVITDPPRAGMSRALRLRLAEWHPERVLMLACDPATWTRDTAFLLDNGYRLAHLELIDLFPSTHHVEILALLERR